MHPLLRRDRGARKDKMGVEAMTTALYLSLVLGGGFMVGVLAILLIILIGTFGAWVAILLSSFKSRRPHQT